MRMRFNLFLRKIGGEIAILGPVFKSIFFDLTASFLWGMPYTGFVALGLRFFLKIIFPLHFLIRHTVFLSYIGAFDSCLGSDNSNLSLGIRSPKVLSRKGSNTEGFAAKAIFNF